MAWTTMMWATTRPSPTKARRKTDAITSILDERPTGRAGGNCLPLWATHLKVLRLEQISTAKEHRYVCYLACIVSGRRFAEQIRHRLFASASLSIARP